MGCLLPWVSCWHSLWGIGSFLPLIVTITTKNKYFGDCTTHTTEESWCKNGYNYDWIDTGSHKSKYHQKKYSSSIQIKINKENILIFYEMISYTLKVVYV